MDGLAFVIDCYKSFFYVVFKNENSAYNYCLRIIENVLIQKHNASEFKEYVNCDVDFRRQREKNDFVMTL